MSDDSYRNGIPAQGTTTSTASSPAPIFPNLILDVTHNQRLPIHRLPTEVLSIIFRNFTRIETCILDPCLTVSRTITLGAICYYWRKITINNSTFWTYIPIRNTAGSRKITSLCLERSRDSLIDISAYLNGGDLWHVEEALPLHTHRVRSLYISARRIANTRLVMECVLSSGVPSSLKHLSIKILSPYRTGSPSDSIISQTSPELREALHGLVKQLHTLRLKGVSLGPGLYSFATSKDLVLERARPTDVARVLTPGNVVQSIEVRHLLSEDAHDSAIEYPVAVESLKKLYLGGVQDFTALCTLLGLIPPGPYELDLTIHLRNTLLTQPDDATSASNLGTPRGGVGALGALLHKFDNITTLTLVSSMATPSQVLCEKVHTLLGDLPNLYYLNLVRFYLNQSLLEAMTRSYDQHSSTFPTLQRLRLRNSRIADYDAFKAMVFSHQINRLRISHCALKWDGEKLAFRPSPSSRLYEWLSSVVPTVSIV